MPPGWRSWFVASLERLRLRVRFRPKSDDFYDAENQQQPCRLIMQHVKDSLRERPVFQDDNAPVHTSRCVQTWLHEHDHEVEHLTWCHQSPDLNIIEHLWGCLENKVRARFPPPRTLFELETVLHEEWVQIPMNFVQDLYFLIPRRMQAVIQAKGGPTSY
ncbi:transposable element Tcb2 transposase [Trichonephila clavipes]|nr:transposable element Tcb2 transposase [Trichonephila clavipes]